MRNIRKMTIRMYQIYQRRGGRLGVPQRVASESKIAIIGPVKRDDWSRDEVKFAGFHGDRLDWLCGVMPTKTIEDHYDLVEQSSEKKLRALPSAMY